MSVSTERKSVAEQPMYVVWVLMLVAAVSLLQWGIPAGIYRLVYGVPNINNLFSIPVVEYSNGVFWKGRIWYETMRASPGNLAGKGTLASFDPDKGDVTESKFQVPFPANGMLAQGDRLWMVSANSVTLIEGESPVEIRPKRLLTRFSEPFLYEDQLAVIDLMARPQPALLVLKNGEWNDLGGIVIPFGFTNALIEGKRKLISVPTQSSTGPSMMDIKVVNHEGTLHVFVSEGSVVAYRAGLQLAPVSAIAPQNVQGFVDLSDLSEWEVVCSVTSIMGKTGRMGWKAGILNQEPIVIATSAAAGGANLFQGNSLLVYRRQEGGWAKIAEKATPAIFNLLAASAGERVYIAGQSLTQTLRIYRVTPTEILPTGVVLKAPETGFQEPLVRWARIYQWVYWPGLLVLALALSRLMSAYLNSRYQFGLTTVEMASITRRGIARVIDMLVVWIPNYATTYYLGMASQEQVTQNMDKMFDSGPEGMMLNMVWLFVTLILTGMVYLFVNSFLQGWWGITLGKWICGIRTVRTTLRPCGFFRALLRELLIVADTLFGMTLLPVTLTIAFSSFRQRLGDMVADTIVIRKPIVIAKNTENVA